jgi:hypothetical protein
MQAPSASEGFPALAGASGSSVTNALRVAVVCDRRLEIGHFGCSDVSPLSSGASRRVQPKRPRAAALQRQGILHCQREVLASFPLGDQQSAYLILMWSPKPLPSPESSCNSVTAPENVSKLQAAVCDRRNPSSVLVCPVWFGAHKAPTGGWTFVGATKPVTA